MHMMHGTKAHCGGPVVLTIPLLLRVSVLTSCQAGIDARSAWKDAAFSLTQEDAACADEGPAPQPPDDAAS